MRSCLLWALLAAAAGFAGQFATVRANYGGNWTGLFCHGDRFELPPSEEFKNVYRIKNSVGFDGEFYHIIAHDPLMMKGWARYVEWPGLRYRRILLPALANVFSFGAPALIAPAYIVVNLVFLALGTWWTSRYAVLAGRHAVWGLVFLFFPATLIALDRLTVDLVFLALFAGGLYYWRTGEWSKLLPVLTLLCLTRETGTLLVGVLVFCCLLRGWWDRAGMVAACTIPFFIWSAVVVARQPAVMQLWLPGNLFAWTWQSLWNNAPAHSVALLAGLIRIVDALSFTGFLVAVCLVLYLAWKRRWDAILLAGAIFAGLGVYLLSLDRWTHVYDYGRVMSPMALALALHAITERRRVLLLPLALMSAGALMYMGWQLVGIVRYWTA